MTEGTGERVRRRDRETEGRRWSGTTERKTEGYRAQLGRIINRGKEEE